MIQRYGRIRGKCFRKYLLLKIYLGYYCVCVCVCVFFGFVNTLHRRGKGPKSPCSSGVEPTYMRYKDKIIAGHEHLCSNVKRQHGHARFEPLLDSDSSSTPWRSQSFLTENSTRTQPVKQIIQSNA